MQQYKKSTFFPFWLTPSCWLLRGEAKKLAEIDHYVKDEVQNKIFKAKIQSLTEYDFKIKEFDILYENKMISDYDYLAGILKCKYDNRKIYADEYELELLDLQYVHKKISEREHSSKKIEMMSDGVEKKLQALEHNFKYHEITEKEYTKEKKTILGEPWFDFGIEYDQLDNEIRLSFDYNVHFWQQLKAEGHPGRSEEEIIDNFIRDWGRKISNDEYNEFEEPEMYPLQTISTDEPNSTDKMTLKLHK